jgi:type I restriction enzyme S subunit
MARALFKSWFVNFDPVRAKMLGGDLGLPKLLLSQFPKALHSGDHGAIPTGWSAVGIDKIARFLNGLALQKFPPSDGQSLPVIKIAQLRSGHTKGADEASSSIPSEFIVNDGDVLFSWSGSLECVLWGGGRGALNQHLFKVTSDTYPRWFYYLWIHEHLEEFRHIAASKATTMGHIQRHHLSAARVVVPPPETLAMASEYIEPIISRILECSIEARALAELRDTLLPKLISGEIRVAAGSLDRDQRA